MDLWVLFQVQKTYLLARCPEGLFEGLPEGLSLGPCSVSSTGGIPSVDDGIPVGRLPEAQYLRKKSANEVR